MSRVTHASQFALRSGSPHEHYNSIIRTEYCNVPVRVGDAHLWQALRYVELNPIRAGLVPDAGFWPWSSAAMHCRGVALDEFVSLDFWRDHWSADAWRQYLAVGEQEAEMAAIRRCTYTARPLATTEIIRELEQRTARRLAPQKGGRPKKLSRHVEQGELTIAR